MNFNLTDEQQLLAESLARMLGDQYGFETRRSIARSDLGSSPQVWRQLAQLGVTALGVPEQFDGLGGGSMDRMTTLQALGRALALEPYLSTVVLGATAITHAGTDAQKATLLPAVASGQLVLGWAHDEADAIPGSLWVSTSAVKSDGTWRITGQKSLVLHGGLAKQFIVTARVGGNADASLALFLVAADAKGLTKREFRLIDDTPAAELTLNDAPAIALGEVNGTSDAAKAIQACLDAGIAAVCADMVGAMETAMQLTQSYVNTRKQFGKLIGEYQSLRHRLADMAVSLEVSRSMAIAAAAAADDPDMPRTDLERAKLLIGRHGRRLAEAAIQSHGGIGMTEEYAVGHCLRRIHVLDQLFGDVEVQVARLVEKAA